MKKLFALTVIIALTISVFAQAPQKMSYQAVIRNSSGQLVTNHVVGMRISILQGSATGTPVYVETQIPSTNGNGLATVEIGGGTVVTGTFSGINWSSGVYYIKTETDPNGGTNYTITGISQILSVPYALYAKTSESITGGSSFTHYVGELYGGGIVISVWKVSGIEHGLIASLADLSTRIIWTTAGSVVFALSPIDGFGKFKCNC
jgi:hypothetical protein